MRWKLVVCWKVELRVNSVDLLCGCLISWMLVGRLLVRLDGRYSLGLLV